MRIRSWAKQSRLAKSRRARRNRRKKCRLGAESLEQRVVLDGSGGLTLVAFSPFIDSELGDDPHTSIMGEDATPIEFDGLTYSSVRSYIDQPNDLDVFQITANGDTLNVGGDATLEISLRLYDADGNIVGPLEAAAADLGDAAIAANEPVTDDGDGFVGCDWGPFGLCDIFPTEPGDTYFVTIGGSEVTDYYFDFFSPLVPEPSNDADSILGDDRHENQIGPDATPIVFDVDSQVTSIHSNLDQPGDTDVFQFEATGGWISAFIAQGHELDLRMEIMDADGAVIATNNEFFVDPIGLSFAEPIVETDLNVGELYYFRVSSPNDEVGEYRIDIFQDIELNTPPPNGTPPNGTPPDGTPNVADSEFGADPHPDAIGPDATVINFGDGSAFDAEQFAFVDSYIDEAGDIDVFQFEATGDWMNAFAFSSNGTFELSVTIHDASGEAIGLHNDFGPEGEWIGPADAEIIPGELYYLVVGAVDGGVGEYMLEVEQHRFVPQPPVGSPDSPQGTDPHADVIGDEATPLDFEGEFAEDGFGESYAHVDSYIDAAGDVDVFQFVADGDWLSAFVFSWDGSFEPQLSIYDGEGSLLSGVHVDLNADGWISPFGDVPLAPGMPYYISIDAADDGAGEYVLDVYQHTWGEPEPPIDPPVEPFPSNPDSVFGADPHVDVIGPDATKFAFDFELGPAGQPLFGHANVDSFVDSEGDVDVFQFVADGNWVDLNVHAISGDISPTVSLYDADGAALGEPFELDVDLDGDGILNGDTPWAYAATTSGMLYFVVVQSEAGGTGEYLLDAFQESWIEPPTPWSNADSEFGEDPHVDEVGPEATLLEFEHFDEWYSFTDVDTYIDSESDIDVFSFTAEKDLLHATSFGVDGRFATSLALYDQDLNLVASTALDLDSDAPDLGWVDSAHIAHDLNVGSMYFLAVSGVNGSTGEYILELSQENNRPIPTEGNPDSNLGDDPHVDQIGRAATRIEFTGNEFGEGYVNIDTYIDTADDTDVFGFQSKGDSVSIYGSAWDGSFGIHVELLNSAGDVLAFADTPGNRPIEIDPTGGLPPGPDPNGEWNDDWFDDDEWVVEPFVFANIEPDEFYFISVSSLDGGSGEYLLDVYQQKTQTTVPVPEPPKTDAPIGEDPHVGEVGPTATVLEFAVPNPGSDTLSSVNSFIDFVGDVDVFQWTAEAGNATVSAYAWASVAGFTVDVFDASENLIAQSQVSGRGEFDGYANLAFPTNVGDSYFVAVTGIGVMPGEYTLNVSQYDPVPFVPSAEADSEFGDDIHADLAGPESTPVEMDEWIEGAVSSHIDVAGDVDTFQITGTGGHMFAMGMTLESLGGIEVVVLDGELNEVALADNPLGVLPGLSVWESIAGETYYVKVAGMNGLTGQYFLDLMGMPVSDDAVEPAEAEVNDSFNLFLSQLPDAPNAGERNGTSGDANFDGQIDTRDYQVWNQNKFTMASGPANGDFNNDGAVDGSDFNMWKSNSFSPSNVGNVARVPRAPLADAVAADEANDVESLSNDDTTAAPIRPNSLTSDAISIANGSVSTEQIDTAIRAIEASDRSEPDLETIETQSGRAERNRSRSGDALVQRRSRLTNQLAIPADGSQADNHQNDIDQSETDKRPSLIDQFFSELDDIL